MKKEKKVYKLDPAFNDLPDVLKNPRCYKRITKKILEAGTSGHEHKNPTAWLKCSVCQNTFLHKRNVIKELGFSSYAQFLKWRKVMDIIHYYKKNGTKESKRKTKARKV